MDEQEEYIEEYEEYPEPHHGPRGISAMTYAILVGVFTAIIIFCVAYLGAYFLENRQEQDEFNVIASIYQQATRGTTPRPTGTVPQTSTTGTGNGTQKPLEILPELQPIYKLNDDLVGYLNFPYEDMNLKYPVMQTPHNSDYYIDHDFYGNQSKSGCPYVPAYCDVFAPTDNVVIFGHNMKTGSMFNKLTNYQDRAYWQDHQTFYFDTLYERHTYRIFAVFKTAGKLYTEDGKQWGYPFHLRNHFDTKAEFDQYIAEIKGAAFGNGQYQGGAFYNTGITPQFGDKLLTLATCEYTMTDPDGYTTNGRLVIVAIRIE